MPSFNAKAFRLLTRATVKRHGLNLEETVAHMRRQANGNALPTLLPLGVKSERCSIAGIDGLRVAVKKPRRTVLYFHGGGFVAGRPATYQNFAGRLAKQLQAEVYLPDYRFAPEHPYPAPIDDAVACYQWLLNNHIAPSTLAIGGDSAGGCMTLATLLRLRDEKTPLPAAAFALSPAGQLDCNNPSMDGNDHLDDMLSADIIRQCAKAYADGQDPGNPYLSPALGDYTDIPPLALAVDEHECLRDSAHDIAHKMREAGGTVELISRWGLFHIWPVFTPFIREAREDTAQIGRFLNRYMNFSDRLKPTA